MFVFKRLLCLTFLLKFCVSANLLFCQFEDSIPNGRLEVMANISNAISRFTGNGTVLTVFEEPFMLGFKISNKEKTYAFRLGVNFNVDNSTEDLGNVSRNTTISSYSPLIGFEWRRSLGGRIQVYGGLDARYYNDLNKTVSKFAVGTPTGNTFHNSVVGFGVGPFMGFVYHLSSRVSLLTEANLYVNFIHSVRKFANEGEPFSVFEDKNLTTFSPMAPTSLYLIVRL